MRQKTKREKPDNQRAGNAAPEKPKRIVENFALLLRRTESQEFDQEPQGGKSRLIFAFFFINDLDVLLAIRSRFRKALSLNAEECFWCSCAGALTATLRDWSLCLPIALRLKTEGDFSSRWFSKALIFRPRKWCGFSWQSPGPKSL